MYGIHRCFQQLIAQAKRHGGLALLTATLVLSSACSPKPAEEIPQARERDVQEAPAPAPKAAEDMTQEEVKQALLETPVMPPTKEDFEALKRDLVAHYTFDEIGEDGRIRDVTGNGHDLFFLPGDAGEESRLMDSPMGKALKFSGGAKAVTKDSNIANRLGKGDLTIAVTFRTSEASFKQFGMLAGWVQRKPHFQVLEIRLQQGRGTNGLLFNLQPPGSSAVVFAPQNIADDTFHMAVGTREAGRFLRIYVDGLAQGYSEDPGRDMSGSDDALFGISAMYPFEGVVAEVMVWAKALTAPQVRALSEERHLLRE